MLTDQAQHLIAILAYMAVVIVIGVVFAIAYVVACCMYGKKRAAKLLAK